MGVDVKLVIGYW